MSASLTSNAAKNAPVVITASEYRSLRLRRTVNARNERMIDLRWYSRSGRDFFASSDGITVPWSALDDLITALGKLRAALVLTERET
jgi:hypothetical protein